MRPISLLMFAKSCSMIPFLSISCLTLVGCSGNSEKANQPATENAVVASEITPLVETILSKEERDSLSPDDVLQVLLDGNQRFVSGTLTSRDHSEQVRQAVLGQHPKAFVLSCVDSRVPVEDVFDRGIGDVFVGRVAGNFINTDMLGSIEFGCKVAGSKLVMVLGHEHCGAVKGAIDKVELGNLTAMLANIQPAVEHFADYDGEKASSNQAFVHMVAEQNVRLAVAQIREQSPTLKEMETAGEIKIVGAIYDMDSGTVEVLND